ncbi:C25 family cysteine peptidase [Actinospongicola halichondriae]|uniref:C25 family cysteine peptidase n=1 Tax=Actinospongicola halichondriae TaxID=3236844 RepID=UPI003D3B5A06
MRDLRLPLSTATRALVVLATVTTGLALAPSMPSAGADVTFTVDDTADLPDIAPGDGFCDAGGGTCTFRAAVEEANATAGADTVVLPGGRFALDSHVAVSDDTIIRGAGMGVTVLDAQSTTYDVAADPRWSVDAASGHRAIVGIAGSPNTVLEDLTIRGGYTEPNGLGGALAFQVGDLTLDGVELYGNAADQAGGAVAFVGNGALTIRDSRIWGNAADVAGGAVWQQGSGSLVVERTLFDGNGAEPTPGTSTSADARFRPRVGGALFAWTASTSILDAEFVSNHASQEGGAVATSGADPVVIRGSRFEGNETGRRGGAVRSATGQLLIVDASEFIGNVAEGRNAADQLVGGLGGAINSPGPANITASTFSENQSLEGGAIAKDGNAASERRIRVADSSITDNFAVRGGGVSSQSDGAAELEYQFYNTSIVGNEATISGRVTDPQAGVGGGIWMGGGPGYGFMTLQFTTVANNSTDGPTGAAGAPTNVGQQLYAPTAGRFQIVNSIIDHVDSAAGQCAGVVGFGKSLVNTDSPDPCPTDPSDLGVNGRILNPDLGDYAVEVGRGHRGLLVDPELAIPVLGDGSCPADTFDARGIARPATNCTPGSLQQGIQVNTMDDAPDDGQCPGGGGICKLREAVGLAPADGTPTAIELTNGGLETLYVLASPITIPDNTDVIIVPNPSAPILSASGKFRLGQATGGHTMFEPSAGALELVSMTFNGLGETPGDGGYIDANGGTVTLRNMDVNGGDASSRGGAVNMVGGTLTVVGGISAGNEAYEGGAFALDTVTATFQHHEFGDGEVGGNAAEREGGSLWALDSDITIFESTFYDSDAGVPPVSAGVGADGGAINASGGSLRLRGTHVLESQIGFGSAFSSRGGAIALDSSGALRIEPTTFTDGYGRTSEFVENATIPDGASSAGGAIRVGDGSAVEITDTLFDSNTARSGGALAFEGTHAVTLTRNRLMNNEAAAGGGGAMYASTSSLALAENDFEANVVNDVPGGAGGGAIFFDDATERTAITSWWGNGFDGNKTLGDQDGGAVSALAVDFLTSITEELWQNNNARGAGGAIASLDPIPLDRVQFVRNQAAGDGGAVRGPAEAVRSTFDTNTAGGNGGGLVLVGGSITGSTFTTNESGAFGGGVFVASTAGSTALIDSATFSDNVSATDGGGVATGAADGSVELSDSEITGNKATGSGGGLAVTGGDADITIRRTSIHDNQASVAGGASFAGATPSTSDIYNTSIINNIAAADASAGVFHASGELLINYSTVDGNTNDNRELQIFSVAPGTDRIVVRQSVIGVNDVTPGCFGGTQWGLGFPVLIQDANGSCAPSLGDPADDTFTRGALSADRTYFEAPPEAIDRSPANECPASGLDQIGTARPQGGLCDVGAIEFASGAVASAVTVDLDIAEATIGTPSSSIHVTEVDGEGLLAASKASGIGATPFSSIPFSSIPYGATRIQAAPFSSIPFSSIPFSSIPFSSIGTGDDGIRAAASAALDAVPLSDVIINYTSFTGETTGWKGLLGDSESPLAGEPLHAVTLLDVITEAYVDGNQALASRFESLEAGDVQIDPNNPVGKLTFPIIAGGAMAIGDLPFVRADGSIGEPDEYLADWCAAIDPLGFDCDELGVEADTNVLALGLAGIPFSSIPYSSIPFSSIPFSSIPFSSIPFSSIPFSSIPFEDTPFSSIPFASIPFSSIPIAKTPFSSIPFSSIPFSSIQFEGTPFSSIPFSSIEFDGVPFSSIPYGATPYSSIMTDTPVVFDGTTYPSFRAVPFSSIPFSSITLADIPFSSIPFSSIPFSSIPFSSIEFGGTDFGAVPFSSIPFSSIPFSSIPFGSIPFSSIPFSSIDDGSVRSIDDIVDCEQFGDCDDAGVTFADVPVEYFRTDVTIGDLLPMFAAIGDVNLGDFGLTEESFGALSFHIDDINEAVPFRTLLGSIPLIAAGDGGLTLGQLQDACNAQIAAGNGGGCKAAIDKLFYGTILWLLLQEGVDGQPAAAPDLTLSDVLLALTSPEEYQWENVSTDDLRKVDPSAGVIDVTAEITVVDAPPTGADDITVEIAAPDGFSVVSFARYVRPASADRMVEGITNADGTTTFEVDDAPEGASTLVVSLSSSYDVGQGIVSAAVTAPYLVDTSTDTVAVEVVQAFEPNDTLDEIGVAADDGTLAPEPTEALPEGVTPNGTPYLADDTIHVTHIADGTDTDLFPVYLEAGKRYSFSIGGLTSDIDAVLYSPPVVGHGGDDLPTIEDDGLNGFVEPHILGDLDLVPESDPGAEPRRLVFGASANRTGTSERIDTGHVVRTGTYVLQLDGFNGAFSAKPVTIRVREFGQVPLPPCQDLDLPFAGETVTNPVGLPTATDLASANTVFLVNQSRLAAVHGGTAADQVMSDLIAVATSGTRSETAWSDVNGVILPLEQFPAQHPQFSTIGAMYDAWSTAAYRCDPTFANLISDEIDAIVDGLRAQHPGIASITIVGGDEIVPFHRQVDLTTAANERSFATSFFNQNNELVSALFGGYLLSDDRYGDSTAGYNVGDRKLFVPDIGVGRLVESASDIRSALQNFLAFEGRLDPDTDGDALVVDYDFLSDGGDVIQDNLEAAGRSVERLTEQDQWTADDLANALGRGNAVASVNAHFDDSRALPADQNAKGTESDVFSTADFAALPDVFDGSIIFSMGCHSGTSVSDVQISGSRDPDWAQTIAAAGGQYVANSGFGYGDTAVVALSERLMALFSDNLDGSMRIGDAMAFAKQAYIGDVLVNGTYDEKILQEAVTYGLPFYKIGAGEPAAPEHAGPRQLTTDPVTGLRTTTVDFDVTDDSDAGEFTRTNTDRGSYYSVDDDIQVTHYRPIQPRTELEVTSGDDAGGLADEAGFALVEAAHHTTTVIDPVIARPTVDESAESAEPGTASQIFPSALQRVADTVTPDGRTQQVVLVPGQFRAGGDTGLGFQRLFDDIDLTVYYRPDGSFDRAAPTIVGSSGLVFDGTDLVFTVDARDAASQLRRVHVLYTTDGADGAWTGLDLAPTAAGTPGSTQRWSGSVSAPTDGDVEYFVQVVDAAGNGAVSSNKGFLFEAEPVVSDPVPDPQPGQVGIRLNGTTPAPAGEAYNAAVEVSLTVNDAQNPQIAIDGAPFVDYQPGSSISVQGHGAHTVRARAAGAPEATASFRIDTAAPVVTILRPADGTHYERPNADDGVLTIQTEATATEGATVTIDPAVITIEDDTPTGKGLVSATATDTAGNTGTASATYRIIDLVTEQSVVKMGETVHLRVAGADPTLAADTVFVWEKHPVHASKDVTATGTPYRPGTAEEGVESSHAFKTPGTYTVEVRFPGTDQVLEYRSFTVQPNGNGNGNGNGKKPKVKMGMSGAYRSETGFDGDISGLGGVLGSLRGILDGLVVVPGTDLDDAVAEIGLFGVLYDDGTVDAVSRLTFEHTGQRFESSAVTSITGTARSATVEGVGTFNGLPDYAFRAEVAEGTRTFILSTKDRVALKITAPDGTVVYDDTRGMLLGRMVDLVRGRLQVDLG